jgi:hypothetical protein
MDMVRGRVQPKHQLDGELVRQGLHILLTQLLGAVGRYILDRFVLAKALAASSRLIISYSAYIHEHGYTRTLDLFGNNTGSSSFRSISRTHLSSLPLERTFGRFSFSASDRLAFGSRLKGMTSDIHRSISHVRPTFAVSRRTFRSVSGGCIAVVTMDEPKHDTAFACGYDDERSAMILSQQPHCGPKPEHSAPLLVWPTVIRSPEIGCPI